MAVDGNWNITMSTPMGERNATLTLATAGGKLTGTQAAEGNSGEIFDGTVNGDDVAWKISITQPLALTLRLHRQGRGRRHVRRNGHRPDGFIPVQGHAGVVLSLSGSGHHHAVNPLGPSADISPPSRMFPPRPTHLYQRRPSSP